VHNTLSRLYKTNIQVCFAKQSLNSFHTCVDVGSLPKKEFSTIVVQQRPGEQIHVFTISIDGIVKFTTENENAAGFPSVEVWTSSPWNEPAKAIIENYQFDSGMYQ